MKSPFDIRLFIHGTMLAFAGASLGNVRESLISAGHAGNVAWALAIALGSALVTLSIMLTHVSRDSDPHAFWWLLITGLLLAGISGALQMRVYETHLPRFPWAVMLGFGLPVVGEICLAFATAHYLRSRERERYRSVSTTIENAVTDRLEAALAHFDPAVIEQHVQRTVNQLAKGAIDSVAEQSLQFYRKTDSPEHSEPLSATSGFGPHNLEKAQSKRAETVQRQSEARKEAILALLAEQSLGVTAISEALGIHRDTAGKYCRELESAGQLTRDGRNWQLVASE